MDVVRTQRKMARRTCSNVVEADMSTTTSYVQTPVKSTLSSSSSPSANHQQQLPQPPPVPVKKKFRFPRLRQRRAVSAPPMRRRRPLLEDHFRVDTERRVVLPGVPRYEEDWPRDCHDCFNLIVLLPLVILDVMNWNWELLLLNDNNKLFTAKGLSEAWTGEWFDLFFQFTALYFVVDLLWIALIPECVRSPWTIIQHHIATIVYITVPYYVPMYRWFMGACMSVEINTWFLIARRVLNKQGFSPWTIDLSFISMRVKLISICFYTTWIAIRCILYPVLMVQIYQAWCTYSKQVGTYWNLVAFSVPLHAAFCLLNLKWTYDLIMSKVRYWRRKGTTAGGAPYVVSKGM